MVFRHERGSTRTCFISPSPRAKECRGASEAIRYLAKDAPAAAVATAAAAGVEVVVAAEGAEAEAAEAAEAAACVKCGVDNRHGLLCDGCDAVFHTHCVGLAGVPVGDWFCQLCTDAGITERGAGLQAGAYTRPLFSST